MITRFLIVDHRGASAILECRVDNTQPIVSGIRTRGVEDGNTHESLGASVTKIF